MEILGDNVPYVAALYALVAGLVLVFVDYGALNEGRLAYRTVAAGGASPVLEAFAALFASSFVAATVVAVVASADVLSRQRRERLGQYELQERVGLVAVMPALQLLTVVLCPVVTGVTVVGGLEFLLGLV